MSTNLTAHRKQQQIQRLRSRLELDDIPQTEDSIARAKAARDAERKLVEAVTGMKLRDEVTRW